MSEEEQTQAPPRRRWRSRRLWEVAMGLGVLLISAVSLFVAYSANRTQERMLAASVWPSLLAGTSNATTDGGRQVSLDLLNRGVGPARIRWAEVRYKDKALAGPSALLAECCGTSEQAAEVSILNTSIQRRVVGAGEWIQPMRVIPRGTPTAAYDALSASLPDVRTRLCYCSVLDECWLLDSEKPEPAPLRECPTPPPVLWGND